MKGTVQRRWKLAEKGDPEDCNHRDDEDKLLWVDQRKDEQGCQRCCARRVRATTWTWQHEVMRNGKRAYVTGTRRQKTEAEKALRESLADHDKGTEVMPNKDTVAMFLRGWLALRKHGLKPGTYRSYSDIIEHRLIPHLGDERLSKLRPEMIARCYDELRKSGRRMAKQGPSEGTVERGLSETSIEHTHRCLHAALEHAAKTRKVARNVADDIEKPKRDRVEMNTWTAEELRAFLASTAGHRLHPLFVTAATTAMRRGELLGLKWTDIDLRGKRWADDDLDGALVSVRRSRTSVGYEVHEGTPKNDKARTVDLDAETVAVLRRWHTAQLEERVAWKGAWTDTGLVFTREDGTGLHPHHVADAFDAAVKRSKLPAVRFHDLRHGWATIALRAGVSPKIVSERLGHASVGFTLDVYAHATPGWQAEAAETFAGLVFGGR